MRSTWRRRRAQGDALVLLNDDSVVDAGYVQRIAGALDPAGGIPMAAGVMRDARSPELIETAGIELDRTLLAYDYLNGEPLTVLEGEVPDPLGPSGAAAAFGREAFLEAGGFDERIFAYLEDVDLVLRLRREGGRCRLARDAQGVHEHSATLGPGSARKDFLAGFGRGYLLRKWSVLSPGRLPGVLVREVGQATVQAVVDRNLGPIRGRVQGLRAGRPAEPYPPPPVLGDPPSLASAVRRRWRRRARLRRSERLSDRGRQLHRDPGVDEPVQDRRALRRVVAAIEAVHAAVEVPVESQRPRATDGARP